MMADKPLNFRQDYRARIAGWYNGYVHIAVIYVIGGTALYIYTQHMGQVLWWEWLVIPIVIFLCNIFEWFLHKEVMHHHINNRGLSAIYQRHNLNHHRFFTDSEMRFRDHKDWRVTVFPPYAMVVFILMSMPAGLIGGFMVTPNVGWLIMSTTTGMYLVYEFMHFCCHVDENAFVRHCPLVNTLRRHHTAHHNSKLMMEVNMNLTFPIADCLFGTSDLDRGLFGHLLNGYSATHLKTDLKDQPKGPLEAAAHPMAAE